MVSDAFHCCTEDTAYGLFIVDLLKYGCNRCIGKRKRGAFRNTQRMSYKLPNQPLARTTSMPIQKPTPPRSVPSRPYPAHQTTTELRQEALRRRQHDETVTPNRPSKPGNHHLHQATTTPTSISTPTNASATSNALARRMSSSGSVDCCETLSGEREDTRYNGGAGGVTSRKEAVPRAGDVAKLAPRSSRDFVASNRLQVHDGTNTR